MTPNNDSISDWKAFIGQKDEEPKVDNYKLHIPKRILEMSKRIVLGDMTIIMNSDKVGYVGKSINVKSYESVRKEMIKKQKTFKYKMKNLKGIKISAYRKASEMLEDKLNLLDKYKILFEHFSISTEVKDWILLCIYTNKGESLHQIKYFNEGEVFSEAKVISKFIDIIKDLTKHNREKILRIEILSADIEYRFDDIDTMPVKSPKFYNYRNVEKLLTINTNIQIWP